MAVKKTTKKDEVVEVVEAKEKLVDEVTGEETPVTPTLKTFSTKNVLGLVQPGIITLYCEFDSKPDLNKLKITADKKWKHVSTLLSDDEKVVEVKYKISSLESDEKFEFVATYNKVTKKCGLPVFKVSNSFLEVVSDKQEYCVGDVAVVKLLFKNYICMEKDKPKTEEIPDGLTKVSGPVSNGFTEMTYKFKIEKAGDKTIVFKCYESGTPNSVARQIVLKCVEPPSEKVYRLKNHNFTSVGDTMLTLCNPKITIKGSDRELIHSAEQQVELGILEEVK